MKATSSLCLSLAAKPNDKSTLVLLQRDSVTFSTARYRFDINRFAAVKTQSEVISTGAGCIHDKPIQGRLTYLHYLVGHET